MLEFFIKDLTGQNKNGTWGINGNKLIRLDLEGKELYHYVFFERSTDVSALGPSGILFIVYDAIKEALEFKLIDSGEEFPLGLISRYKLYPLLTDTVKTVRRNIELARNASSIMGFTKVKNDSQPKKKTYNDRTRDNNSLKDDVIGRPLTKEERILKLIRRNEDRVGFRK